MSKDSDVQSFLDIPFAFSYEKRVHQNGLVVVSLRFFVEYFIVCIGRG